MEDKEYDKYVEELLPHYFTGDISKEESLLVEEWISMSEEHARIAKQINLLLLASDTVRIKKEINTQKALADVSGKLIEKKNISWWQYAQRIAAILFIPLVVLYAFRPSKTQETLQAGLIQVRANPGTTTRLMLPDSSIVYLNSESTLEYPSSFDRDTRNVLLDGEAFFEVKPSNNQKFIVSTLSHVKVEVVGTKFNVDAYKNTSFISVTLIEGKVNFLFKENTQEKRLAIQAGQKTVYDRSTAKVRLIKTSGRSETAWTDGKIIFEKTPFEEALKMLENRHHVEFVIKNSRFENDFFSGEFTSQRLDRILEHFKISSNIHWKYLETDHEKEEKTKIEIY